MEYIFFTEIHVKLDCKRWKTFFKELRHLWVVIRAVQYKDDDDDDDDDDENDEGDDNNNNNDVAAAELLR